MKSSQNRSFRRFHSSAAARASENTDAKGAEGAGESTAEGEAEAAKSSSDSSAEQDRMIVELKEKIESLEIKLDESKEKIEDTISKLRYAQADGENARKRSTVEVRKKWSWGRVAWIHPDTISGSPRRILSPKN